MFFFFDKLQISTKAKQQFNKRNLEVIIFGVLFVCCLFVVCTPSSVGPSVGWSVGRSVGGFEDWRMGDLKGSWGYGRPT